MAEQCTNALEELSCKLRLIYAENVSNDFYCANIGKAMRIITELAKVTDVTEVVNLKEIKRPNAWFSIDAITRCRAIAEEGVK